MKHKDLVNLTVHKYLTALKELSVAAEIDMDIEIDARFHSQIIELVGEEKGKSDLATVLKVMAICILSTNPEELE